MYLKTSIISVFGIKINRENMESFLNLTKIDSSAFKAEDAGNGLEDYQINEEIGQGSFGKVYSAMEKATGNRVAIK